MSVIKRLFGKPKIARPIIDTCNYKDNGQSYCGNSLSESNVLFITNERNQTNDIEEFILREECEVKKIRLDKDQRVKVGDIIETGMDDCIGPFQHIIMLYRISSKDIDVCEAIYEDLKNIAEYMISTNVNGSICVALISEKELSLQMRATIKGIESLIKGLGCVLPKHRIIINGIVAESIIPMNSIMKVIIFLSGKYGQVLTGEIIQMMEE